VSDRVSIAIDDLSIRKVMNDTLATAAFPYALEGG